MTKKQINILPLPKEIEEEVEEVEEEFEEIEEEDDNIEAPPTPPPVKAKKVRKGVIEPYDVKPKPKRVQTEAQKENTRKMIEARRIKNERIREEKARRAEEEKAELENKIVKKAITIKKKQMKKTKAIDDISDDETPVEEVVKTVKKRAVIKETVYIENPKPRFSFI